MFEQGNHIIQSLRKKWEREKVIQLALIAFSISILAGAIVYTISGLSMWFVLLFFPVIFGVLLLLIKSWRVSNNEVAVLLDQHIPELQESSSLFLKERTELGFLENLQVKKISGVLSDAEKPRPFAGILRNALIIFLITAIASVGIVQARTFFSTLVSTRDKAVAAKTAPKEILPAALSSVEVEIVPPSYTGKKSRTQTSMNLEVEAGSKVTWTFATTSDAKQVEIIFNDSNSISAKAKNNSTKEWSYSLPVKNSGFYQLKIDGTLSEYFKLESVKDREPQILIKSPAAHSSIDYGQKPLSTIRSTISDDYGIKDAILVATIASGKGEAVKFKEQKITLNGFSAGKNQYDLQQNIDLAKLGMVPGDELYFFISATDYLQQETKSDIHTIKIQDTAELMSIDGLISGVDLKPEFFRSQRQIIIETELLIKSKASMTELAFKEKSNDLGNDQKLLRLRYGKFLGEESSTEIGGEQHGDEDHDEIKPEDFGNAAKIADPYTHKHDIAEDATFFDPETKKQLRATLNEMWSAELRLRTYKPEEALPFEYKALRLLKDLQQQSRVYVAKTTTKTTPLKPEKRLTGELDKITEPSSKNKFDAAPDAATALRLALSILEEISINGLVSEKENELLAPAAQQLSERASSEPTQYLLAFEALKKIRNSDITTRNIRTAQSGLNRMLRSNSTKPSASSSSPGAGLSGEYFRNLNKKEGRP